MSNYNSQLQSNNTDLQAILNSINELPEAGGGINLPNLTNEGSASDLLSGKEFINSSGNKVTGTFSIDNELNTQDSLIAQIQATVNSLPEAGSGNSEMISISNHSNSIDEVYYFNSSFEIKVAFIGETFQALYGIVIYCDGNTLSIQSGDGIKGEYGRYQAIKFNSNGGVVCVYQYGGSN